jgi:hypothetical protein
MPIYITSRSSLGHSMSDLTPRQQQILRFIQDSMRSKTEHMAVIKRRGFQMILRVRAMVMVAKRNSEGKRSQVCGCPFLQFVRYTILRVPAFQTLPSQMTCLQEVKKFADESGHAPVTARACRLPCNEEVTVDNRRLVRGFHRS